MDNVHNFTDKPLSAVLQEMVVIVCHMITAMMVRTLDCSHDKQHHVLALTGDTR